VEGAGQPGNAWSVAQVATRGLQSVQSHRAGKPNRKSFCFFFQKEAFSFLTFLQKTFVLFGGVLAAGLGVP
jgi:hypothetical protein